MGLYNLYLGCDCRVTTDSRTVEGGEMFFALKGENFDGNEYAMSAIGKGAAYAVVNRDADLPEDERLIRVDNPFKELQELAMEHRTRVCGGSLPLVGLTGTNGKTTTKELTAAVLSRKFKVCATSGNLNNDIGVPLSILRIRPDTQIAVIEMGASHPNDIAKLVKVCRPDYGLITNVGKAHLLGFGSFEGVKAAKGELYRWLGSHDGSTIFLNEDDEVLCGMAAEQPCTKIGYGLKCQGAEILPASTAEPFLRININGRTIHTRLIGAYNAANVLAAISVGEHFGVPFEDAVEAIESYTPSNSRSQMSTTARNTLIIDAYNANPSSMAAALDNFALVESARKAALLGDMRELGEDSLKEHVRIVLKTQEMGIDTMFVGEEFKKALKQTGIEAAWFSDSGKLAEYLKENPMDNAVILIKGSNSISMGKVVESL